MAQRAAKPASVANSLPTDWSHRHVVFSTPNTAEKAARIQHSTRYQQQLSRQELRPDAVVHKPTPAQIRYWRRHRRHRRGLRMHRDWSVDLGPTATVGAGMYPAKFSFDLNNATCGLVTPPAIPDYVVFGTSVLGSSMQGTIVALTNLYAGCGGQVPGDYWSYDTTGQVLTSPVLSLDGTQVAFTQTTGGVASLAILKWARFDGFINSPTLLTPLSAGSYFGCTAPCMTTLPLGANDTKSSVYYDYDSDTAYVGDDSGTLHRFTTVFLGTPTESVGGGWPVAVGGSRLTGPVYDAASGNVFVGDQGGFLYRVDSAGTVGASGRLDFAGGFTEGPIVDSTAGTIYAFSSSNGAGAANVVQLPNSFGAGSTGTAAAVGTATAATTPIYDGAFDHDYLNTSSTGDLWVCGNPGGFPTLYQIPIVSGVMGTPRVGPPLGTTSQVPCSPTTVVYNDVLQGAGLPLEWAFASVQGAGQPTPCGGFSCVMNFRVTTWQPNTVYNVGQEILDSNLSIQVAETPLSTSGATAPVWNTVSFGTTLDGTVHWRNQGPLSTQTPGSWAANTNYPEGTQLIDTNNNIEVESFLGGGISGGTQPAWPPNEGGTVSDGPSVVWYNLGANPVAALPASGGTSGIIIDNIVNNPGGSQVYFTNLQDIGCFTSGGTGGCAVQASQQGLQ
jgi:hypothetical protein